MCKFSVEKGLQTDWCVGNHHLDQYVARKLKDIVSPVDLVVTLKDGLKLSRCATDLFHMDKEAPGFRNWESHSNSTGQAKLFNMRDYRYFEDGNIFRAEACQYKYTKRVMWSSQHAESSVMLHDLRNVLSKEFDASSDHFEPPKELLL